MAQITRLALLLSFLVCFSLSTADSLTEDPMAIFAAMVDGYQSLQSYQDEGVIEERYFREGQWERTFFTRFSTHYSRPGRLRFEWTDPAIYATKETEHLILANENEIARYESENQPVLEHSEFAALSVYAGPTAGVSYRVPVYLRLGLTHALRRSIASVELLGMDTHGEQELYLLRVNYRAGNPEKLWISKPPFRLMKVEKFLSLNDGGEKIVQTIIEYNNVAADLPLDTELFTSQSKPGADSEAVW